MKSLPAFLLCCLLLSPPFLIAIYATALVCWGMG